jgi:hypothetical protein
MEDFKIIEFQRRRDFGKKMNATFEFVRQNFKPLFYSILIISGPTALASSFAMGGMMGDLMSIMQNAANPDFARNLMFSSSYWLQIVLLMIFGTITFVLTISTVNNYIVLYHEKRTNKIEVTEVWSRVRQTFWMYFGTSFLFFLLLLVVYIVLIIPIVLLGLASPFLIFFGILLFIVGLCYVLISSILTFFIRGYEKLGFFQAVSRSFFLVRSKWWSTFGLIVILSMIVSTISYVFLVPYYIVIFTSTLHQVNPDSFSEPSPTLMLISKIFFGLYYLAYILLSALPNVGLAFQYFNLVELKEAKGLMKDLESFGQTPDPTANRTQENF